jgi:hypothetical protein
LPRTRALALATNESTVSLNMPCAPPRLQAWHRDGGKPEFCPTISEYNNLSTGSTKIDCPHCQGISYLLDWNPEIPGRSEVCSWAGISFQLPC